ncbi:MULTISPECIES: Stk1 family PASTA domain-containing Ser/Thr kinase [Protofrankia]|uniref:Stk1 family PASTA domain-containing Ser/Thr kinase n=1 Tax=Protofrankia TaxID=2994361 RepID=UPI0002F4A58D|nr:MULTISPECIES: Stk1 family PASTA domain-containing Ser/Thr kinase [Protofrankia]
MDATVADPVIGRLLDGRYTAQERIAVGGMATVYVAHDNRLDRLVALKVMHPAFTHDEDYLRRFQQEATAAARLNTPCVVSVLDQGRDHGPSGPVIYLVMELVRGQTLRQLIGSRGRLTPTEAIEIIEPVLEALAAAHNAGIIHRDIKPENILLGHDGQVKVADFGLARPLNQATHAMTQGVVMGTVDYLAPEQVSDGSASPRSDVYAAGVVLYEMLIGVLPHTGSTPMSVAYQSVHGEVPAPSAAAEGIPAELDALVLHATARDLDMRPADGTAMLDELHRVLPYLPAPAAGTVHTAAPGGGVHSARGAGARRRSRPRATAGFALGSRRSPEWRYRLLSRRFRGRRPVLAAVTAAVVLLCGIVVASRALSGPGTAPVPPLVGLDQAAAVQALTDAGFTVAYDEAATSDTIPAGKVMAQEPDGAVRATRGSTVRIRLSLGRAKVRVPDVATLSVAEAQARLTRQQLNLSTTPRTEANDTIPAGNVIRTEPAVNTELAAGAQVTLIVSSGPAMAVVPNVINVPIATAQSQLGALGLKVTRLDVNDETVQSGNVIRTSPDPGQPVTRGSVVTVLVSKGPVDDEDRGDLVEVPNVINQKYQNAARELQRRGLRPERNGFVFFDDTVVRSTDPPPGTKVKKGTKVTLTIG